MKLPKGMVPYDRISRRYASVLFHLPEADRALVYRELISFVQWAQQDHEGWRFLTSNFLPLRYQRDFLDQFCDRSKCSVMTQRFFKILAKHDRLSILPKILQRLEQLFEEESGHRPVYTVTARSLTDAERSEIRELLKERLGGKIDLREEHDEQLLLGGVLFWGGFMMDLSLRRKFQMLYKRIGYGKNNA